LDFVDIHAYVDPLQVGKAHGAIRSVSGVPIVILESGADWRPGSAITIANQQGWFRAMDEETDKFVISAWHVHHSTGAQNVAPMSVMDDVSLKLTPIGSMI
jgi:uncharacterized protein YbaA (DUF1428 family)